MRCKKIYFLSILFLFASLTQAQKPIPAADQTNQYFPILKEKKLGIVANQTSIISTVNLVDSLLHAGFTIQKVFAPEHGFRGQEEAGAEIKDGIDTKTGLKLISLHGKYKKPQTEDLSDIDLMLFDIQDVGARFYTYISSLSYVMEACAENNIPLLILDRPNPNANYIDGPVLQEKYKSFVGLLPIPIVHAMTLGELAQMINGEGWLKDKVQCEIKVITVRNYNHKLPYSIKIAPSPNLPTDNSIALYPSLCLFEGTPISIGRGTEFPFEVIGYPGYNESGFSFEPQSIPGKSLYPKFLNQKCSGIDLRTDCSLNDRPTKINLGYLINFYSTYPDKDHFFTDFFNLLAGTNELQNQIKASWTEDEIRKSWQAELNQFKLKRKKYLLYTD